MTAAVKTLRRTPLEAWVLGRADAGDREGLRRYQARALRRTVARAARRSPFYAELLAGIDPGDLATPDDIARLPFTTADDVREQGMRLLCVRPGEVDRIVTLPTSGTSGAAKRIHFTAADQELTTDFFRQGMSVLVEPGDRVLVLMPGERPGSIGDLLRCGLARMGASAVVHGPVRDPHAALAVLADGGFDAVVGIPVQLLGLARRSLAERLDLRLRSVLLSTDHCSNALRAAVERAWRCRVFDHYGSTEMGLGGGVECAAHGGYHLREADLLFEVVDPQTGRPVPDGEYGEVVFTTLTREAMPLVRYRTGDRSRFLPAPCPCGSMLRRLDRVRARLAGRVALADGTVLELADLDEALFALPDVLDYRAELTRRGGRDHLLLRVFALNGAPAPPLEDCLVALRAAPTLGSAVRSGAVLVEVTVTANPWPGSDGTAKRAFVQSQAMTEKCP